MHKIKWGLALLATLSIGCLQLTEEATDEADSESTGSAWEEPTSLEASEDGGYDSEDEEANFGLESMDQYAADEETDDPTVSEEETEEESGIEIYVVRIVWGNLELNGYDDEDREEIESTWIDWTGSLSYSGDGLLLLRRTILFDRYDSVIEEEDPLLIEWESYTGPHIDGILAELIVTSSGEEETPVLTFATDSLTQEIPLDELDRYNEIVTVDEDGHGVAFTALRVEDGDCREGFLEGKFHNRPEGDEGGIFRGRVLSEFGDLTGHLRGHYGVSGEGEKLLFGKYISDTGRFRAFLHGEYGNGAFEGNWVSRDGTTEGTVDGQYVTGATVNSGFFQGFWNETCE